MSYLHGRDMVWVDGATEREQIMAFQYKNINPFDVEAELIGNLKLLDREKFYDTERRRTMCDPPDVEQQTRQFLQTLPYVRDEKKLIAFGVPAEEMDLIRKWEYINSFAHVQCLLRLFSQQMPLTRILGSVYFHSITHTKDGRAIEFSQLNTNEKETGIAVYPKIKTINDPLDPADEGEKHWAADRIRGINSELANTYYVELDELQYAGSAIMSKTRFCRGTCSRRERKNSLWPYAP